MGSVFPPIAPHLLTFRHTVLALEAGDQRTVTNIDAAFSAIIETSRREVPTAIAGAGLKLIEDLELGVRQPG
jgi:hypothetical protein